MGRQPWANMFGPERWQWPSALLSFCQYQCRCAMTSPDRRWEYPASSPSHASAERQSQTSSRWGERVSAVKETACTAKPWCIEKKPTRPSTGFDPIGYLWTDVIRTTNENKQTVVRDWNLYRCKSENVFVSLTTNAVADVVAVSARVTWANFVFE